MTEGVEKKCAECGVELPPERVLTKCRECMATYMEEWRDGLTLGPTAEFPGVDIDAVHYKTGTALKPRPAVVAPIVIPVFVEKPKMEKPKVEVKAEPVKSKAWFGVEIA